METAISVLMSPLIVVWCHCDKHHNVPTVASALTNRTAGVHKSDRHPSEASTRGSHPSKASTRGSKQEEEEERDMWHRYKDAPRRQPHSPGDSSPVNKDATSAGGTLRRHQRRASSYHSLLSPCRTMYFFLLNQQMWLKYKITGYHWIKRLLYLTETSLE